MSLRICAGQSGHLLSAIAPNIHFLNTRIISVDTQTPATLINPIANGYTDIVIKNLARIDATVKSHDKGTLF